MDFQSFVSAKVAEELVTHTLNALQSVTQKAPAAELKALVTGEVAKLGTFTFKSGLDLGTVVARIRTLAERAAPQFKEETPSYEALYTAAMVLDDGFVSEEIQSIALQMATPFGGVINTLRYELPPQVDALCADIRRKADALAIELNPRRIAPAQVFNWGKLSSPNFVDRVKTTTLELTNIFKRAPTPNDLDILVSRTSEHMYAITPVMQNVTAVKQEILSLVSEDDPARPSLECALAVVLQPTMATNLLAFEKRVFDREMNTGRLDLIPFIEQVHMLSSGLESLDKVLSGITASDNMPSIMLAAARLKRLDTVLTLMFGAIQLYRETMIKDSIIIPNARAGRETPPAAESIYVNGDALPGYQAALTEAGVAAEEALTDVTVLCHYYHLRGATIGANGLKVAKALELRSGAYEEVNAAVATESSAEKMAKDRALSIALQKVMEGPLKRKVDTYPHAEELLRMRSAQRLQRAQLDLGHGVLALEDQVTHYLIDLEMQPAMSAFQTTLSRSMRHWGEAVGSVEAVRSLAFCQSIAQTVTTFLSESQLVKQAGARG